MKDSTYNGWRNYETWNVALWIQNEEALYALARLTNNYEEFIATGRTSFVSLEAKTPDGVKWNDPKVDVEELNEMIWNDKEGS